MIGQVSVAAATAVLGYDLAGDQTWRVSGNNRRLRAMGLAGSAAALDAKVGVFIGNTRIGELYNTSTGAVARNTDMFEGGQNVPAGTPISVIVEDAPVTNPLNFTVDLAG